MSTQYILRRLLLFTLTYFAKCQLFSTFFVVKYNPVSQYTYIFCVSLFTIFPQQICSTYAVFSTISPKRITPQAQKTKSRSNGKIKEFRNHLWSSTAAQKQENSTSSFNREWLDEQQAKDHFYIKMQWSSSWKWIWKWPALGIIHHQKCPLLNGPMWEQFLIEDLFSSYKAAWNTVLHTVIRNFFLTVVLPKIWNILERHKKMSSQPFYIRTKFWKYITFFIKPILF